MSGQDAVAQIKVEAELIVRASTVKSPKREEDPER
jgi:hypothetical protein